MTASEDGWEPAQVGEDACEWVTVPGTNVTLELMKGWPSTIMRAYAADFNAYVEPLRDADSAAWTPTNSVPTSNHLNGTAMDCNWGSHPFHAKGTFNAGQMSTIRELLAFYENTIYWGGDWTDPIDEMHWQMGYGSFNNPHTGDFIARKIRADGFSRFRRGDAPPAPAPMSDTDKVALLIIQTAAARGYSREETIACIATGIQESNLNEAAVDSTGHVGVYQQDGGYPDRGTAAGNVTGFFNRLDSKRASPGASPDIWKDIFWLQQRPSELSADAAYANGREAYLTEIQSRIVAATDYYNRLATPGDDMAAVPQEQWDALYAKIVGKVESQSPFRSLGEGEIWDQNQMWLNDDGMVHPQYVEWAASRGDSVSLAVLQGLASGDVTKFPDRIEDIRLAQQVLARLGNPPAPAPAPAPVNPIPNPTPNPTPNPPAPINPPGTINISTAQLMRWGKDAVTVLGALGTWATAAHNLLGQYFTPEASVAVPGILAALTATFAAHTVKQRNTALKEGSK